MIQSDTFYPVEEPPAAAVAKAVGVFALVGAGLGVTTLIFLWVSGFFDTSKASGIEEIGAAFLAGIAIAIVLVFALLVGVVLAAIAGLHFSRSSVTRSRAVGVGAITGGIGHVAMVAVMGAILLLGIEIFRTEPAMPASTPQPTQSAQERQDCIDTFGADSPLCTQDNSSSESSDTEATDAVTVNNLLKLALGLAPAALVGAGSAALFFPRYAHDVPS